MEILFRGKRKDNGEWVEGFLLIETLYRNTREYFIVPKNFSLTCEEIQDYYIVIPETVGQYTGIKDKNGKKIFEGDVVEGTTYKEPIVAKTSAKCKGLVSIRPEILWVKWNIPRGFRTYPSLEDKDIEVIGNRWDNPELLREVRR